MSGLELFLASTTLTASGLWLIERHFRRAWEKIAISSGERLAHSVRNTEGALCLLGASREVTDSVVIAASHHRLLSRGIDPRRDALWRDS